MHLLLLSYYCCAGVHCDIYKSSYSVSLLNSPSPSSSFIPSPHSWNSFNKPQFSIFIFTLLHPLLISFPCPLVPTSRQDLFYLQLSLFIDLIFFSQWAKPVLPFSQPVHGWVHFFVPPPQDDWYLTRQLFVWGGVLCLAASLPSTNPMPAASSPPQLWHQKCLQTSRCLTKYKPPLVKKHCFKMASLSVPVTLGCLGGWLDESFLSPSLQLF
jgi:hypothetical protein